MATMSLFLAAKTAIETEHALAFLGKPTSTVYTLNTKSQYSC